MRACSTAGSAAEPETSSRAPRQRARDRRVGLGRVGEPVVHRRHARTASSPPRRRARARSPRARSGRRGATPPPRRSGPSIPSTSPCTWNSGSAWTTTSSAVHAQASARASRFVAIARRGISDALGRARWCRTCRRPAPPGSAPGCRRGRRRPRAPQVDVGRGSSAGHVARPAPRGPAAGALSPRMCSSSRSPDFGFSGTAGTPASSAPTTATTVCAETSAHTPTRSAPATWSATAAAASRIPR